MQRTLFTEQHKEFGRRYRCFLEQEIKPHYHTWEKEGGVPGEIWKKAGAQGFLGLQVPKEFGGQGIKDWRYNAVINEESVRLSVRGLPISLQNEVILPYLLSYGTPEQIETWVPKIVQGEIIASIAMSEAEAGSDLAAISTFAEDRDDHYKVNGSKKFISYGMSSELLILGVKTQPEKREKGISLLLLEARAEGVVRRPLQKIGFLAQDTAEIHLKNVLVPKECLLGKEGRGFFYLTEQLPAERLSIAVHAVAAASWSLQQTIDFCQKRKAFGQPIGKFQHISFKLAEMKTEVQIAQVFVDKCIELINQSKLSFEDVAMAKWWCTELQKKVIDQCLQLHGGQGYLHENPIARSFVDTRVLSIYAGTSEIMKQTIARFMGF